jgi:hypothetical protein
VIELFGCQATGGCPAPPVRQWDNAYERRCGDGGCFNIRYEVWTDGPECERSTYLGVIE